MQNNFKNRIVGFSALIFLTIFLFSIGLFFWSSFGISLFLVLSLRFFYNLGKAVDIRDLIVVLSALQWIIGPYLAYYFYLPSENTYNMVTPENQYMSFVVPATFLFIVGLYIPFKMSRYNTVYTLKQISATVIKYKNLDLFFIVIGLFFNIIWAKMPGAIKFISFLFGNLHFIGLLFLLQNKSRKNRNLYLVLTFLFTFLGALNSGMFHDLILWLGFLFMFIAYIKQFSFVKKTGILLSMIFFIIVLQTVKVQFRTIIWSNDNKATTSGQKAELFYDLVSQNVGGSFFMSQGNMNNLITRINQGWIISRIMYHVPSYEPFANGETIYAGLTSTLLPRFIYENKAKAGGVHNFERFTGHQLQSGTSMNLSILGEAYANFGQNAIWFMFLFGLFLNYSYAIIKKKIIKSPTLLFFIPIIYLQVVKAETDFVTVLNHLIKASIFVALVYWGLKTFFKVRL